jgi:hypothetical protein
MCRRCDAPDDRYFVRDRQSERLVCEECGFAVTHISAQAYDAGDYIWRVNPAWPEFHSFDQLLSLIRYGDDFHLPPCGPLSNMPSRLLTFAFDMLIGSDEPGEPRG